MAKNNIRYEGRIINRKGDGVGDSAKLSKTSTGKGCLELVVAEGFSERNKNAPEKFKRPEKGPEDWVNTFTKWHRIRIFGSIEPGSPLYEIATNPNFNHGAVLEISAAYSTREYTRTKDNVEVSDDRESIFLDVDQKDDGYDTWLEIKVSQGGTELIASEGFRVPVWDGKSELPTLGSGGGGAPAAPDYGDNVGF